MAGWTDPETPELPPSAHLALCNDLRMDDWERLLEAAPWLLEPGATVTTGDPEPWTRGGLEDLPKLSALLSTATVTPVSLAGASYEVLAWGTPDQRRGWLCLPPEASSAVAVHDTHRRFWSVCGGIVDRFGEPVSWWLNQDCVLTPSAAQMPVSDVLEDYGWLWEDAGLVLPIDPDDFYVVAVEANGNLTLAQRRSGALLLFAPDHAFKGVRALPDCPPCSLMTIDEAPDLTSWIEVCAERWLHG